MTVSPNRPQDGKLPPAFGGNGVEPNDRSSLANLPPTLFRLPNLAMHQAAAGDGTAFGAADRDLHQSLQFDSDADTVDQRFTAETEESQVSSAERVTAPTPVPVGFSSSRQADSHFGDSLVAAAAEVVADAKARSLHPELAGPITTQGELGEPLAATEPSSQDKPAAPVAASSPSRPPAPDAPAGRSWMESIGSHGVVIVLLLVVVAAALLTGKGEEDPAATSLTTQSELLNFDELAADLPLPSHQPNLAPADVLPAETYQATIAPGQDASTAQVATAEPAAMSAPATAAPSVDQTPESVLSQPSVEANQAPSVSLDNPMPIKVQTFEPRSGEALAASGVQTNQFVFPDSGIEAKTVSERDVHSAATDGSLPSLEQLEGLQNQVGQASQPKTNAAIRVQSKTPVGIADWSKYLPPLNVAAEPDAGTSSFNN